MDKLVTFDCFDTVVTRAVGEPRSVSYLVARRLAELGHEFGGAEVFASARVAAEDLTYRRLGDRYTLSDVMRQLVDLLGLDAEVAPDLERAELDVERSITRAVPAGVAQVEAARATGAQIGFLSDTPLPRAFVGELLTTSGAMRDGDLLWVSNELGAGKDRGTAFFEVAKSLPERPRKWEHYGDNPRGDVRMARLSGVAGQWVSRGRLNRYEKLLEGAAQSTGGFSSLLAGASRRTRLVLEVERPDIDGDRATVIAGVAAPTLVGYVLWCLRRAQRAGCSRVYFVARDGEVMLQIARRLIRGLGLEMDLRYLEGSRRAWLLPSMGDVDAGRLAAVLGREEKVTVRKCLEWVDLLPEDVGQVLSEAGLPASVWDARLDPPGVSRMVDLMTGALSERVAERSRARTAATQDYLRQEGLLEETPFAVVDIGWQGTVGRLLTAVLERCGGQPPAVECYFGLTKPQHDAEGRDPRGYMYDEWRGTGAGTRFVDDWVALEMFAAPTHGRVGGYERDGNVVRPIRGDAGPAHALEWGLEAVRHGIDVFCDELAPTLGLLDPYVDVRAATWSALRTFWLLPTAAEVRAWGDFPFEEDDELHYAIAEGLSGREVLASLRARSPRLRRRGTWPAGVRARASRPVRAMDRGAKSIGELAGKAARVQMFAMGRRRVARRGRDA
ncbi:hypothetical protein [Cellulomonas sp. ATA003]|uniref:hypothetical protein n=1 Tax=Cellulomonas sp. ATA003 TaxID=3073064 RepID=UPI0028730D87|nr:hypothetical protein [Cellulomonas sp. ATA003]WNB85431.1 hypothetical protein REH70_17905 [Cellulomonas sp. ATA003]